jgi:hypothetical protein
MLIKEAPARIARWDHVLIGFVHVAPLTALSSAPEPLLAERMAMAPPGMMLQSSSANSSGGSYFMTPMAVSHDPGQRCIHYTTLVSVLQVVSNSLLQFLAKPPVFSAGGKSIDDGWWAKQPLADNGYSQVAGDPEARCKAFGLVSDCRASARQTKCLKAAG